MNSPQTAVPEQRLESIPINLIAPSPDNPRKEFNHEAMHDLVASIRTKGVVEPIVVRPLPDGQAGYQIIAGERRYKAAKTVGLATVPAVVREVDDKEARALRMIENIQREDLTLPEECVAVEQLLATYTLEEVCAQLGKSKPWVSKRGGAKDLPAPVQKLIKNGKLADLEIASSLGELYGIDKDRANALVQDLDDDPRFAEPVTRERARDEVKYAKERLKRDADVQKQQARAQRPEPSEPSPEEKRIAARQRKVAKVGAERKEFRDKAMPAIYAAMGMKLKDTHWENPIKLEYGESLAALQGSGKIPNDAEECDYTLRADGEVEMLKKLAGGLPKKPEVRVVLPNLTLDQAQRMSDALKDIRDKLDLGFEVTISGGDVLKLVKKLAPGKDLMCSPSEQIAMFLVDHTTKAKDGQIKAGDLFAKYSSWSTAKKFEAMDLTAFGNAITAAGVTKKRISTGWQYLGLALKA